MVEAVIETGLARQGALRRHAAIRRRNENEAEDGGRPTIPAAMLARSASASALSGAEDHPFSRGFRAGRRVGMRPRRAAPGRRAPTRCKIGAPEARNILAASASVKLRTRVPRSVRGGLRDAAGGEKAAESRCRFR
jgi:hypothetical protein